jgi:hypothetical protein
MAKIYGLFGSMTGKLADVVMSVRNGEQLARKYQPVVFNPSTSAQVAQRAKLKLLSQLSAVLAPAIAIRRQGPVSARNLFTKKNFGLTSYASDTAQITLAAVQLTDSVVGLSSLGVTRAAGSITASLNYAEPELDRMVYVVLVKEDGDKLRYLSSTVVSKEESSSFVADINVSDSYNVVLYGYGVRLNTETAKAVFSNLTAPTAETVAKLIVSRTLTESDVTLTETRGAEVASVNSRGDDEPEKKSKK